MHNVNSNIQFSDTTSEIAAISCRSMLFLQQGINGVLYRTGEHVFITVNEITQQVIRATDFLLHA